MKKYIFPFIVALFWLVVIIIFGISMYLKRVNTITKKSILGGYKSSSIIDYRLLIYEDSTYYLSTLQLLGYERVSKWLLDNDTIKLRYNDSIGAKIYNNTLIEYYDDHFKCLTIMDLRSFDPPKIVKFPNDY